MFSILILIVMATALSLIIVMVLNLTSKKTLNDREKASPFECGFDPKNFARMPFSIHFFLIAIVFVIFDIELTLFLPIIIILKTASPSNIITCTASFIIIVLLGLFHEIYQGSLNWTS